jgi:site-specific recombinase XerD
MPTKTASHRELNLVMTERFRRWMFAQEYAASTIDRYCKVAVALCKYIRQTPMQDVTPMMVGDFLTHTSPSRQSSIGFSYSLGALRCFFDFLYLGGIVDKVAPRFIRARSRIKKLPRVLTQTQVRKLLKFAKTPRDRALIEVCYSTGCRVSELANLRVEQIDFGKRKVAVRAKRRERMVYFGLPALKAVRRYIGKRRHGYLFQDTIPPQKGYITYYKLAWQGHWRDHRTRKHQCKFLGNPANMSRTAAWRKFKQHLAKVDLERPKPNRPLTRSTLAKIVQEIGRKAGLGLISPKVLRHSFATHMLEQGADITAIQELMGHSYLSSTQVYARISSKAVASAYKSFHPRAA